MKLMGCSLYRNPSMGPQVLISVRTHIVFRISPSPLSLLVLLFSIHFTSPLYSPESALLIAHNLSMTIMPDTCIKFGELGARVMIENKEVEHYNIYVDPVKKEVSCWIASEAGKVRESPFTLSSCSSNKSRRFQLYG